jgi:intracellular septation protein
MLQSPVSLSPSIFIHIGSEFVPVLAFYTTSHFASFTVSAGVLAGSTALATLISLAYERRVPIVSVSSSVFVCGAGLLSYLLAVPDILIIADSIYYFLTAFALWAALQYRRNLLKSIFDGAFALSARGWSILTWQWIIGAVLAGVGNELVRHYATPEFWINYKLVKLLLILLFIGTTIILARSYSEDSISSAAAGN